MSSSDNSHPLIPLITNAGLAASFNASSTGIAANITHIAVGEGSYTPNVNQTTLVSEKQRVSVVDGEKVESTMIRLNAVIAGGDQYWINEVGFFLGDGTLLAVWSDSKPYSYITYSRNQLDGTVEVTGYGASFQTGNYLLTYIGSNQFQLVAPDHTVLGVATVGVEYSDSHLTFTITGSGWIANDQAQIRVWASKPLGYKAPDVSFDFSFYLLLSALPANSINVTVTGPSLNLSATDGAIVNFARSQIVQDLELIEFNDRLLLLGV